jgi:hypothetical protein
MTAIWSTLLVEAAIAILLCFRGTRLWGIALGMAFHSLLALHPHKGLYSFSAMLFALFFLFVPEERLEAANVAYRPTALHRWFRSVLVLIGVLLGVLVVLRGCGAIQSDQVHLLNRFVYYMGLGLWLIYATCLTWLFIKIARTGARTTAHAAFGLWPRRRFLLVMPALVVFNGFNPYLGLKTQSSFAMFSNLRTEGERSNHLFIPRWIRIADYQDHLVEILRSSDPALQAFADQHLCLTFFELRRHANDGGDGFWVEYRYRGETVHRTRHAHPDHELFTPIPWWLRKLLAFRAVDCDGPQRCRH